MLQIDNPDPSATPPGSSLTATTLTIPAEITGLREQWQALAARCPAAGLFCSWEWADGWYSAFADRGAVECLTVRGERGELVGLAPLFLPDRGDGNLSAGEAGFFASHGPSWGHYPELLAAPGVETAVAEQTVARLQQLPHAGRGLRLLRVQPDSPSLPHLAAAAATRGHALYLRPGLSAAYAPLPSDPSEVLPGLPDADHRGNCRTALRRLTREHPSAEFRIVQEPTEVQRVLGELADLNIARHDHKGESSHFRNPRYLDCFYRSHANFLASGWLRLHVLQVEGRAAAVASLVQHRETLYLLHTGFDQDFAVYGPSHLVLLKGMEQGVREGARLLDMLTWYGYKARYCPLRHQLVDAQVLPLTARALWPLAAELPLTAARAVARRLRGRKG